MYDGSLPRDMVACDSFLWAWSPVNPELQVAAEAEAFEGRSHSQVFGISNEHYRHI